ncbi:sialate O-acetylesterase [Stieleria bergensis]
MLITCVTVSLAFADLTYQPPAKIYVLVGQSNMQGKGAVEGDQSNSLRYLVQHDPNQEYQFLVDPKGNWRSRQDVWIHYDSGPGNLRFGKLKPGYGSHGGVIGPELGFGHVIGESYEGKALLIKACWGGKSLGHNFLPPSVGQYPPPNQPADPGFYYHQILRIVDDVTRNIETYFPDYQGQGIEIAGLCYHQGWNDQYGGLDARYEQNLAAFIHDIRSAEHGLGIPDLPVVIATSGMIENDSPIKRGQLAMGDPAKYPQFAGNVGVVNTDKPYGTEALGFKFYTESSPDKVGYHWNNHAHSYLNIGRAMATEMQTLSKPKLPSRLRAVGTAQGVRLTWQVGRQSPATIKLLRNGQPLAANLPASLTTVTDARATPGKNTYQLLFDMPSDGLQTLSVTSDTSVGKLQAYRSSTGVQLNWDACGKYDGFQIRRDGQVIANQLAGDLRSYLDKQAPEQGNVQYIVTPTTGSSTPASLSVQLGPADPGGALLYEPFDYPADADQPRSLLGLGGAAGTKGEYDYLSDQKLERAPAAIGGGLSFGALPVTGNRGSSHRWSPGCAIELDDSLREAGLLADGATLWISFVFRLTKDIEHRQGGGTVLLSTDDLRQAVGLMADNREFRTVVVVDGKPKGVRITSSRLETPTLVVGKIVWGKDGSDDTFVPYTPGHDLQIPEKHGRPAAPFNIDQSKLNRLVLKGEGQYDEIRVGTSYQSVVGGKAN